MRKPPPGEIINPFSDAFLEHWHIWKDYKKETFGFVYKGVYSEQMTLKKLCELSNGDEQKAILILEQSIMRQWQGIFPLHIPSKNGRTANKQQQSTPKSQQPVTSNTEKFKREFMRRNGGGEENGDSTHLKAV